jgi:uncharacterized membrane protein
MKTKPNINITKKQKIGLLISFLIIILLFLSILTIRGRIYDSKINLLIAPASATITIDDKEYKNGIHEISSGKHIITISKWGFETQTEEIEITPKETYIYYNYLLPPNGLMTWYTEHEDDSLLLESIIPALTQKELKQLQEKYPLIKHLPINISEYNQDRTKYINYSISYVTLDNKKVLISIHDHSGGNYDIAIKKIESLGYNIDDYNIYYAEDSQASNWAKTE